MRRNDRNVNYKTLTESQVDSITHYVEPRLFKTTTELFYQGQVPEACFILVKGGVNILKGKTLVTSLGPGSLIGARELLSDNLAKYTAQILAHSEAIILLKSQLLEIMKEPEHPLKHLLSEEEVA